MNTTIAIVLPAWMAWLVVGLIALQASNAIAELYIKWLQRKVEKLKMRNSADAA
ncbi:MAG: hypothetical protein ABI114_00495 [Rhodanobacter sp.]